MGFFQAMAVSILLYGCSTLTLTKRVEKKPDRNNTRMLCAVLNKSYKQHSTKQQLCSHVPPITKNIQIIQTRHVEFFCRSKDKLSHNILLSTLTR